MKIATALVTVTLALSLALAGCSSTTMIRSNVPGAQVFLDGQYVGNTPYAMTDTKIVGSSTQVRIVAPGYAPTTATITRNEQFSVGACIGGVFLLVPFLWIMEYKPDHLYQLTPGNGAAPMPAPGGYPAPAPGYPQPAPAPAPGAPYASK